MQSSCSPATSLQLLLAAFCLLLLLLLVQGSERRLVDAAVRDCRVVVPVALIRAAFPDRCELPIPVQLSVYKDGQQLGKPHISCPRMLSA